MLGRAPHLPHSHHSDHPHPLPRQILISILVAALLATIVLLLLPPSAHGNFVYWTNQGGTTIGRAKINGTAVNNAFITTTGDSMNDDPHGVAADSHFIYWSHGDDTHGAIGRANLDGSGANPNFIPHTSDLNTPFGVAVTPNAIFWANGKQFIGRANLDGSNPVSHFIDIGAADFLCGLAADGSFVYWGDSSTHDIGRASQGGGAPTNGFIPGADLFCGPSVDSSFLYWGTQSSSIGRAPVTGGTPDNSFIPAAAPGDPCGTAINPQYIFWPNASNIGRANINGSSPNPALFGGATNPCLLAAAPSNKITISSVTRRKKKGTAIVDAKVPGPGQVGIANTGTQDVAATATVKQPGLTLTSASSFKLPIKPVGKKLKKLKKKGKVKVTAYVTFVPAGVAGVFNSQPVTVKLIKRRKKK